MSQPTLFDAPPAPSGPEAAIPTAKAGRIDAYLRWRSSPDGKRALDLMAREAEARARGGATRIAVNDLAEYVRREHHLAVNNSYRAWISDWLVTSYPMLGAFIERRKRRQA